MEYRIETKSAILLTGVPVRTTMKEGKCFRDIPAHWDRCFADGTAPRLAGLIPKGSAVGLAGVSAEFDGEGGEFSYFVAIEAPEDRSALPANCRDVPVPSGTWGIFTCRGPIPQAMQETMQRIYGEWFPSSGWEHAPAPELEVYPEGDVRSPDYVSEIWIPLQRPPT